MVQLFDDAKVNIYENNLNDSNEIILSNMQYCMLGDALTAFKVDTVTDFFFVDNSISITNKNGDSFISESDSSFVVRGDIFNAGPKPDKPFDLMIIREVNSVRDTVLTSVGDVCPSYHFVVEVPINGKIGTNNITLIIDPYNISTEKNKSNNIISKIVDVQQVNLFPVEPLPYWTITNTHPKFRIINPVSDKYEFSYKFKILQDKDITVQAISESKESETIVGSECIDWNSAVTLETNKLYWLAVIVTNHTLSLENSPYYIPFYTDNPITTENFTNLKIADKGLINAKTVNADLITDQKSSYFTFKTEKVSYDAFSVNGNASQNVLRNAFVSVNDTIALTTPPAPVGMTLVVYDKDLKFNSIKYFYTWGGDNPGQDSASIKLVSYLRDSISYGNYVFLVTCDEAFRQFYVHNSLHTIGSWDTLKTVLKSYGSALTDSIDANNKLNSYYDIWHTSFVMLGQKGAEPGSIPEAVNFKGDTARIVGFFDRISKYSTITFPQIGPAKHWNNIIFNSKDPGDNNIHVKLYGYNKSTQFVPELLMQSNDLALNIESIDANKYPYLVPVVELTRNPLISNTKIYGLSSEFVPASEVSIMKSKTSFENGLLLGQDNIIKFTLKNLSLRSTLDSASLDLSISDDSGILDSYSKQIKNLSKDTESEVTISPITDNFPYSVSLNAVFNNGNVVPELYDFNNNAKFQQTFTPDTVKPTAILKIDGLEIHGGEWVAVQSKFDVIINDNSPLKFDDVKYLQLRINSIYQTEATSQNYKFVNYGKQTPKKAELSFLSDSLEFGENLIRIYLMDVNQNRDTVIYRINVSKNGFIQNISNYPNPIKEGTEFSFDYLAPKQGGLAKIEIFNYNGQLVSSISHPITIGKNSIKWNGLDNSNHSLPIGVYLYKISISGTEVWVEPITEKFLVLP